MRRVTLFVVVSSLLIAAAAGRGERTRAQTAAGPIQSSSQLQLPATAFPSDYNGDAGEAWTASDAEGSTFSQLHAKAYGYLGLQGAWYQYYAKVITMASGNVTYVSPVEVSYLGTYYLDSASAQNAFSDVATNPQNTNPQPCSYGTRCVTFPLSLQWKGVTYLGLARIVQQGNAVAEIESDVYEKMYDQVGAAQFASNLDGVSRAFVQVAPSSPPSSTPVPPTATPTSTPLPAATPAPTATPSPTATATPIPLSFEVLSVRAERYGSKPDMSLQRSPLKQVKAGTKLYLSIYVLVRSAPPDSTATFDFRLTPSGKTVLRRSKRLTLSSTGTQTYRVVVAYKMTKAGAYSFRGAVTIHGETKQLSTVIRVAG